jgi:hypothetical protein
MKVAYCDESGTGGEPFAVMTGVVVDSQRMHVTKSEWADLLRELSTLTGRDIKEFHTREFYPGYGVWHGLHGQKRADVMEMIADWIAERKHHVVIVACDVAAHSASKGADALHPEVRSLWRFLATHLILALQKEHQAHEKTKGHTLLVFDQEKSEEAAFADLVATPPAWTDSYYKRGEKSIALPHIVDVPYFADSKHVALIQTADYAAFVFRKYLELVTGRVAEKYQGELQKIERWALKLAKRAVSTSSIYPEAGRCACGDLFYGHAPKELRLLLRKAK